MVVGVCHITLLVHGSRSLKDKRQVLKGILEKTRNRFNVSVAEVGANDLWQRAELGFAVAGVDAQFVNSVIDKVLVFIEGMHAAEVADHAIEIINC
ncbi:MAG: DUF503 domain-containing protein [Deltaproteobacteria bacterium]|nr:DUF503 domain-containing protein [Deltaproteobacteria bacterium]